MSSMEFLNVEHTEQQRWIQVWKLYEESFPEQERRKEEDHLRACEDDRFFPLSVWDKNLLIGLMFYWEWDSYRYLEHFAINPELRGQGNGSQLLTNLQDSEHTIILEIDPLINELSVRRLQFYERAGYTITPFRFVHLPYRKDGKKEELLILSYPEMLTKDQHKSFQHFINEEVIKYCEGYPFEFKK